MTWIQYLPGPVLATSSTRVMHPRFSWRFASYDVASAKCQALGRGAGRRGGPGGALQLLHAEKVRGRRAWHILLATSSNAFKPSIVVLNGTLFAAGYLKWRSTVRNLATLSKQTVRFAIQLYSMTILPSISQEWATAI